MDCSDSDNRGRSALMRERKSTNKTIVLINYCYSRLLLVLQRLQSNLAAGIIMRSISMYKITHRHRHRHRHNLPHTHTKTRTDALQNILRYQKQENPTYEDGYPIVQIPSMRALVIPTTISPSYKIYQLM